MHHSSKPPKSSTHMSPKAKRTTTVSSSHAGCRRPCSSRDRCARSRSLTAELEPVPLLLPVVGVVVVAVPLPEARLVDRRQLDPVQPLRALPEVLRGYEEAHRPPVLE